jgi:hypothetical protein
MNCIRCKDTGVIRKDAYLGLLSETFCTCGVGRTKWDVIEGLIRSLVKWKTLKWSA